MEEEEEEVSSEETTAAGREKEDEEEDRPRLWRRLLIVSFKSLRRLDEDEDDEGLGS